MKRKIYLLHRRLSIIIALPVLLWASSGLMHPIMTNIRPAVATQGWRPVAVDPVRIKAPLPMALHAHHLDSFTAVRFVHIDTNWFYQVKPVDAGAVPVYISCTNGKVLPMGDWLYAQYLARHFLEGSESHGTAMAADDCCGAATACVLHPGRGAEVTNVSLLKDFDNEYKSINRLLPVYRVNFDRPDGIRIYVETGQDRFSFAVDKRRAMFDTFFRICHTWGWLDWMGRWRLVVEVMVAFLAFCTAALGIWIFFMTRRKTKGMRRYHRWTAIVAVLFTLMWSFSGGYHAFTKWVTPDEPAVEPVHFAAAGVNLDLDKLQQAVQGKVANIGLVRMKGQDWWRVSLLPSERKALLATVSKDLMKDGKAAMNPVAYVSTTDYSVLPEGDREYALSLAARFSGNRPTSEVKGVSPVTAFGDEYNFTDKRLPVWRVAYAGDHNERIYVETCSGELAARVDDAAYAEGYSFSVFHKHHFMDWGGKAVRDGSTIFWASLQILLVAIGLLLFFRFRK